jgi:hypothetical protein
MGQSISVQSKQMDAVCVFTTDRSITGQDGAGFGSADEAEAAGGFAATLAVRLFAADDSIDHVYVASNDVIVRRDGSWSGEQINVAADTIRNLFLHYV